MYDVLGGLSKGYIYPNQEFFYTDLNFPTVVTKITFRDEHSKLKMEIEISLIQPSDIANNPSDYASGSEGRPKQVKYFLYDNFGNKADIK